MGIFLLLCILELSTSQAAGQVNSTQMYYAKLTIDKSAIGYVTEILTLFRSHPTLRVYDLQKTTTCQNILSSTVCTCEPDYRWSDKVCESNKKCCGNETCNFPQNSSRMCVSNNAVTVTGSISLKADQYQHCLAEKNSPLFQECNNKLLIKIKNTYSTLRGFDILTISQYRVGSIIADFEMTIANKVVPQDLINRTEELSITLQASFRLETTGVVHLSMPRTPVCYSCQCNLICTLQEDLNTPPLWQMKRRGRVFNITNGTESKVTSETLETKVLLKDTSILWAGVYSCVYRQSKSNSYTIYHKATGVLDVCHLPDIDITTIPGFPHCKNSSDILIVKVRCEIDRSNETFSVTWERQNKLVGVTELKPGSAEGTIHEAETIVSCDSSMVKPRLTCTFKNRCNQERTASVDINVIYENDQFCEAEGDWEVTKAGFTAVKKCTNAAGERRRKCQMGSTHGTWESEVSACVHKKVHNVLQKAYVVGIGLGSLNENAAHVFSLLENVTNNSHTINTFANLNVSVEVLSTLSQKQNLRPSESTADDFLTSSSNMLEKSLKKSWETKADDGNFSMADRYLSSVEQLIHVANITGVPKKKNLEVAANNCSKGSSCKNTVFNVTVVLDGQDPGTVKTAGFQHLEKYLPNNDDNFMPNSIVVTTTTERKQSEDVEVEINFQLLEPRPRNVELKCVSWDNNTRGWSSKGCIWKGSFEEGICSCNHLSSFAILMSKYPLEIPGISVITYIGLTLSVSSLVISLIIKLTVWSAVVKTNTLYLRHTAHINISLCLLVADCCFLASFKPLGISLIWCKTLVVLKHFCYLSMFFWMLSLSSTLLHQAVFPFHNVSKKNYLRFSLVLGYGCPLLIVAVTFLTNNAGAEGSYFSHQTCWLVYAGLMKGSIYTFLIPVGIIVFVNIISMVVVIMKLLNHPRTIEMCHNKERNDAKTVLRSVILLTPVFGGTWILGFAVLFLDLTTGKLAFVANYAFALLNAFQGLFILISTCLGDKLTRDALLKRFKNTASSLSTDSSTKVESTGKNSKSSQIRALLK